MISETGHLLLSLAEQLIGMTHEELDYERPLSERDLAESWEGNRFDKDGGDFGNETWEVVQETVYEDVRQ